MRSARSFTTRGWTRRRRATSSACRRYTRSRVGKDGDLPPEPGVELTQMGYEFWPEALEQTIRYAAARAKVPVYVTENGIGTEDDTRRVEYIKRALAGVQKCLADGIDVRGYIHWSLLDNFEWIFGYRPKFGLVAVNRETQARTVKPSGRMLGEIARNARNCGSPSARGWGAASHDEDRFAGQYCGPSRMKELEEFVRQLRAAPRERYVGFQLVSPQPDVQLLSRQPQASRGLRLVAARLAAAPARSSAARRPSRCSSRPTVPGRSSSSERQVLGRRSDRRRRESPRARARCAARARCRAT